jgi:PPP family 3-phenylpropionic acid transporter
MTIDAESRPTAAPPLDDVAPRVRLLGRWDVDPLLLSKLTFLFYFGAMGCLAPYLSLHYRAIGLSNSDIGLLGGLGPLMTLVAAPLWGSLADILRQHKLMLVIGIGGLCACMVGIALATSLAMLIPLIMLYMFCGSPIGALLDNTTLNLLGKNRHLYGKQRVGGAAAWGVTAAVMGVITQRWGLSNIFFGFFAFMAITLAVALHLPIRSPKLGVSYRAALQALARQRWWAVVLVSIWLMMAGRATGFSFVMLRLNDLGATRSLMGLTVLASSLSDVPMYFFADRMMRRWGPRGCLILAMVSTVILLAGYGLVRAPWPFIFIQLLAGPAFAPMWVAGVEFARRAAPPGLGATTQALFGAVCWGLGAGSGNFVFGRVYDALGAPTMFLIASGLVTVAALFYLIAGRHAPEA